MVMLRLKDSDLKMFIETYEFYKIVLEKRFNSHGISFSRQPLVQHERINNSFRRSLVSRLSTMTLNSGVATAVPRIFLISGN